MYFSGREAARANAHVLALTLVGHDVYAPEIRQPAPPRPVVGMAHIVAEAHTLAANITNACHNQSTSSIIDMSAASPGR